jgi:uncharacterized OB-fold protein
MRAPLVEPDWNEHLTVPYWEGFQEEEIRLPRCEGCETFHWYPKTICPECYETDTTWQALSGRSTVATWVGINYDMRLPFLKDNVPLYTGLVVPVETENTRVPALLEGGESEPEIGQVVKPTFVESEDGTKAPVFELVGERSR